MNITTSIPNNLLLEDNKGEINLLHDFANGGKVNYKLTIVLDYLQINKNLLGYTSFSIEDIILSYGYKPDAHKGKINEQILDIIKYLADKQLVTDFNVDINNIKSNTFIKCKYNSAETCIAIMNYDWVYKIINNTEKIDVSKMLTYLAYLCARMYKNPKGTDVARDGGKYEVCYPSMKKITSEIGINNNTLDKYNAWLMENKIIKYKNIGNYYNVTDKNRVVKQGSNIYTIYDNNADTNLIEGIKQYKEKYKQDRVYVTDKVKKKVSSKRQISNTINRINVLEQKGQATDEQIKKRNEIIENIENTKDFDIEDLKAQLSDLVEDGDIRRVLDIINVNNETYTVQTYLKAIDYIKNENKPVKSMGRKKDFEEQFNDDKEKQVNSAPKVREWYSVNDDNYDLAEDLFA